MSIREFKITASIIVLLCWGLTQTLIAQNNQFGTYYNQRLSLFQLLPNTKGEIIFLGNSITDGGEWVELLNHRKAKNRGISGDVTEGVLFRLDEVTSSTPAKVFLLIGINDLARGVGQETVFENICKIVRTIRASSPKTKVFVQSILPVNNEFETFRGHTSKTNEVLWINQQLRQWCKQEKVTYVDLFSSFVTPGTSRLNPNYTNDGLHLTGAGYLKWVEIVKPLL
jgi:lysophospholipase L1-like esterase